MLCNFVARRSAGLPAPPAGAAATGSSICDVQQSVIRTEYCIPSEPFGLALLRLCVNYSDAADSISCNKPDCRF